MSVPATPHPFRALLSALALSAAFAIPAVSAQPVTPPADSGTPGSTAAPETEISPEVLYKILVGDIALQRGEPELAARAYFEAARDAQDAVLARRATEVALFARQRALALEAARLWQKLEPDSERAKQMATTLAQPGAMSGDLKGELERVLANAAGNPGMLGDAFLQLNRALSAQEDKTAVFRMVSELAKPYPAVAEAHLAVAIAGYNTGLKDLEVVAVSVREANRALELKPDWERGALVKADLLAKQSPEAATAYLRTFLDANPKSRSVAGALAELLLEQKRYADARTVFQRLLEDEPNSREMQFAVAAISVQLRDYATAQKLFLELRAADYGEPGAVAFYLAQIAEETNHYDQAIAYYGEVNTGDRAWLAKLRIGAVLARQGKIDEAMRYLDALPTDGKQQEVEVSQAEAQILRDAGDYKGAYAVLAKALVAQPESADLLYDIAMVAEKLDRFDEVESRLMHLIDVSPDNAQALNALGYTLVDRTARTEEGLKLIEKAHALAPDDPFILDSMGWAYYRLGNVNESEKYLRRAIAQRPDPEIAAHLGEVLWAKGERDRANDIWQSQLKETPDNPVLLETVRRLAH